MENRRGEKYENRRGKKAIKLQKKHKNKRKRIYRVWLLNTFVITRIPILSFRQLDCVAT